MIHRAKTCFKNAVFLQDDLICKKCGKQLGVRYYIDGKIYLYILENKYKHLLQDSEEIPELSKPTASFNVTYDLMIPEILSELSEGLVLSNYEEEDEASETVEEDECIREEIL